MISAGHATKRTASPGHWMRQAMGPISSMVWKIGSFLCCRKKSNGCHSARHPYGFANEISSAPSPTHSSRHRSPGARAAPD